MPVRRILATGQTLPSASAYDRLALADSHGYVAEVLKRAMPRALAVVFAVLGVIALAGAYLTTANPTWRPFPAELMALVGIGLIALATAWFLSGRPVATVATRFAWLGAVIGIPIGIFGLAGTAQVVGDYCSRPATASLASSLPPLSCSEVGPSLAVGLYLILIGVAAATSIATLVFIDPADS